MNRHQSRLWTEHRVAGDEGSAATFVADRVGAIFGFHFEHGTGQNVAEVDPTLDFGLHDVPIHRIAEVWARLKKPRLRHVRCRLDIHYL